MTCPVHFLANPELFFTASRIALFSVMARPSRSHNLQSVSANFFPLPVVDQVLEVYDRQPYLSPDAMAFSCFVFRGSILLGEKSLYSPHPIRPS